MQVLHGDLKSKNVLLGGNHNIAKVGPSSVAQLLITPTSRGKLP